MTEKHIPKRFQMPTLWGQILSLDVPPFTWKYLLRKSLGELAWALVKFSDNLHPTRHPRKPLGGKAKDWIESWFKPLLWSHREFLQLGKFALPPSFGEIVQTRGKSHLTLLPSTTGEGTTFSITELTAAAVCATAFAAVPLVSFWPARRRGCTVRVRPCGCTVARLEPGTPQQCRVPSASASANRGWAAVKATLSTDSEGARDHFVISFHFIWCQRCGSLK